MKSKIIFFAILLGVSTSVQAVNYDYKTVEDFEPLSNFSSVESFEKNYQRYTQDCLDNTGGGTGGIKCFISYKIWDRELNIYYNKVYKSLDKNGKVLLKKSQLTWIAERDQSSAFNSFLIDKEYAGKKGTMYSLLKAGDASKAISPIVKQRALVLKGWYEYMYPTSIKSASTTPEGTNQASIPDKFLGEWDLKSGNLCSKDMSDSKITIKPHAISYWESMGSVKDLKVINNNSVKLSLLMRGEGETWGSELMLNLENNSLILEKDKLTNTYVKC